MTKIFLDMDGTIADLYGVEDWLDYLLAQNPYPYMAAKPLVNMSALARRIHKLQNLGYEVGIISWLSKTTTAEYDELVTDAKMRWLKKHLPSVQFDEIHIVSYGTPKSECGFGYLFDDEERNREEWKGIAYDVENILEVLKNFG